MAYNLLKPVHAVVDGDMSTASITSEIIEVENQDNVGVQLVWTGTPSGTFDFQVSLTHQQDIQGNVTVPGTWTSIPVSPGIVAAGSADDAYVDLNQLSAMYFRVVYTRTSGTGVLNVFIAAKGV